LIRKAYNALTRTLQNNDSDFMESADMLMVDNDIENEEDGNENSDDIESNLIGRPLFRLFLLQFLMINPLWSALLENWLEPCANYILLFWIPLTINVSGRLFFTRTDDHQSFHRIQKKNGTTYCAHPNYNSFGEWYDWAMVKLKLRKKQVICQMKNRVDIMQTIIIQIRFFVSCNQKMIHFMQLYTAALQVHIMKMAFLWNAGKKNMMLLMGKLCHC